MNNLDSSPGERVRAARRAAGLTQEQLASRLEIRREYLAAVERGVRKPTLDWLYDVAGAIGCNPSDLDVRLTPR